MARHALLTALLLLAPPALAAEPPKAADQPPARPDEPTKPAADAAPNAGYGPGGFFIQSDDGSYLLRVGGWLQGRFTFDSDEKEDLSRANGYRFSLHRARLKLSGNTFSKHLRYSIFFDFGQGNPQLLDYFMDWRAIPGTLHVTIGQFKRPWSRQFLAAPTGLQLVDRAATNGLGAGRDIGLMLSNGVKGSQPFAWAFGVFNGTGYKASLHGQADDEGVVTGKFTNVPNKLLPMLVLRLAYNHAGIDGYTETDFEGGPFRWSLGVSGLLAFDAPGEDKSSLGVQGDLIVKWEHLAFSTGLYLLNRQDGPSFGDRAFDRAGLHLQAGYVIADTVELAARYTQLFETGDVVVKQGTFGVNVFFNRHVVWQTDGTVAYTERTGPTLTDYQVRTQLQLVL